MASEKAVAEDAVGATIRKNEFKFLLPGVSNFNFSIVDYCVTEGQPFEGISTIVCDVEGATLYVKAGRHKSSETASWFKTVIETGATIGCDTDADLPEELNFAFRGNMSFTFRDKTYSGENVVLAQGSNAFRNNWWIGGPDMSPHLPLQGEVATIVQNFKISSQSLGAEVTFSKSSSNVESVQMGV